MCICVLKMHLIMLNKVDGMVHCALLRRVSV